MLGAWIDSKIVLCLETIQGILINNCLRSRLSSKIENIFRSFQNSDSFLFKTGEFERAFLTTVYFFLSCFV